MKTRLLTALFMLLGFCGFAQKPPTKLGEIPLEDLKMTTYSKDSSADAVVLVDYGKAYIDARGDEAVLVYERYARIKILNKDGLSAADVSILLYHGATADEKVSNLKATTYNLENGKVTEVDLSKDGIFTEKFNRYYNIRKFTLPNVKEGSIIEYSYTVNSDFFTNFPNWQFQKDIPVRHSEYWAIFPDSYIYEKYMQGYLTTSYEVKPQVTAGLSVQGHHWVMKDVPAFKEEPYLTSKDDYVSRINFALATINGTTRVIDVMGSWQTLNERLSQDEDFGTVIAKSGFLKETVEEVTAGMTDPMQKAQAIHAYVSQNIEWDGVEDFYAGNLKKIIEQKKGSSGDINLILASMLSKAGLEVDMVLLSTRDHGIIRKQYPMSKQFNYVVCAVKIGDKTLFMDATEKYLPMTVIPERCINGEGLIISKTFKGWVDIGSKIKSRTVADAELTLDENGEVKGKLSYTFDGYDGLDARNSYFKKGEEAYVKDFLSDRSWNVEKTEFETLNDLTKPVKQIHTLTVPEQGSAAGDVIYLNPYVALQMEKNPFVHEKRVYPVDYGTLLEKVYIARIKIPDGYAAEEIPQSKIIGLPGGAGRFTYNASVAGNIVSVTSNFQINRRLFSQEEYGMLREYYSQVVAKQAEQIVLKKK